MSAGGGKRPLIRLEGLAVGYGRRRVLEGLCARIEAGQFVTLLGPNGAGKTTLLKTLARLLAPLGGAVWLEGRRLEELNPRQVARRQAVVLTGRPVVGRLSVFELVALGRHPHTGFWGRLTSRDRRRVEEALGLVGAEELAGRAVEDLSDGERQKVMLARALAQEPRLILLDEPTLHLDLRHRLEVLGILVELCRRRGITVVASLHEVELAARVSDLVALVRGGRLAAWGPPERVLGGEAVARLYDLNHARYDPGLGLIELAPPTAGGEPVFVVAGGGSGAGLLRVLARGGFALAAGVLHRGDLDCLVARALGARVVAEEPFRSISAAALARARELMSPCRAVVDSGFPLGEVNRANRGLVAAALGRGQPVFSLRPEAEARRLWPQAREDLRFFADPLDLAGALAVERKGEGVV